MRRINVLKSSHLLTPEKHRNENMGQFTKIFNALGAVAFCLLAYPGIFSGLSNDGKQGTAPILSFAFPATTLIFVGVYPTHVFHMEVPLLIPGNYCRELNKLQSIKPFV